MFEEFAGKGSRVKYLNANGSDFERERANQVLREGQELIVESIEIGRWYSYYTFSGLNREFNTVMFEVVEHKPVLFESWSITSDNRLTGIFAGNFLTTSHIRVMDEQAGVCKTKNSTYYLGSPQIV